MMKYFQLLFLLCCFLGALCEPHCLIELECAECIPDSMPLIRSHRSANGTVAITSSEEVLLACPGGKFLQYPMLDSLVVVCEEGRFRVRTDNKLRHLLELGCQENVFEDVLHQVEHCGSPYQGRAYQVAHSGHSLHLAALCFDEDSAITLRAHATPAGRLHMPPHSEASSPLSLLGNFNHMFDARTRQDAEKLYSDDVAMNKRLKELFKHDKVCFADQSLTSAKLLSRGYFDDQNSRVTDFVSNKIAAWRSVAFGNLLNLQKDVSKVMRMRSHADLHVYSGTHDVLTLRTGLVSTKVYLKPGKRFPVPKYIWTVVHDEKSDKAVALVTLNDPFIAVSEIREAIFCDSVCSKLNWLNELRVNRNFETPLYGLVFCCNVHEFASIVREMPREVFTNVPWANEGLLAEI